MAAVHAAGPGLVPLFILGDVNEDGQVNEKDLELVRQYVDSGSQLKPPEAISCLAAADVDLNGKVDERDLADLTEWIKRKVTAPALSYQSVLPCDFNHFFIAASPSIRPGGVANIRFLDPRLNSSNSTVEIEQGDAVVAPARSGRGYDIKARSTVKPGAQIVLKIGLPHARQYYYTLTVDEGIARGALHASGSA